MSGWYPDPGGEPNRYRFWDGSSWSPTTSSDPSQPPPSASAPSTPTRRFPAALLVVAAVIVVGALLAVWLIRGAATGRPYTDDPLPTDTSSAWDDSSPPPVPSGSPTPSARTDGSCVSAQPNVRAAHPADGRVHGGDLAFPAAAELDPAGNEPRFSFAWDVSQQIKGVHDRPGWIAQLAVGQLRAEDGFTGGPRRVAEQVLRCTVTSNMYEPYEPTRRDRRAAAASFDGVTGWQIDADITVAVRGLPFPGDRVRLLVIPDGENYSFFFSAVPLGDPTWEAVAERTRAALART